MTVVAFSPAQRKGLVTPSGSPIFGTDGAVRATGRASANAVEGELPFFVDWLTIAQDHDLAALGLPELPQVNAGLVWAADADGSLSWRAVRALKIEGSHETGVNVKCEGSRVTFSGNVSRFGRPDNLFGYSFFECLKRINEILAQLDLPDFTAGKRIEITRKDGGADYRYSGARVSRIDLTSNFEAGSPEAAHAFLAWLGSQHAGRQEGQTLGQGETVSFGGGKGSRQYWKAYIKHLEMARHGVEGQVFDYCSDNGVVRFEGTLRTKVLTDIGAAWLGDYERGHAMGELVQLFDKRAELLARAEKKTDDFDELPKAFRLTARDYLAGADCRGSMSKTQFYRHRAALLPYGIDIAVRNIKPFAPRVQVITLRPAVMPAWYSLAAA